MTIETRPVFQWLDSSGNGNTLTRVSANESPIFHSGLQNGNGGLTWDRNFAEQLTSDNLAFSRYLWNAAGSSIFFLEAALDASQSTFDFWCGNGRSFYNFQNAGQYIDYNAGGGTRGQIPQPDNTAHLFTIVSTPSSASASNMVANLDGLQKFSLAQNGPGTLDFPLEVGDAQSGAGYGNSSVPWSGNKYEFIIFQSALALADFQTVEGYLAWKWGIQAKLPAGHPYAAAAPAGFLPTSLPSIAAWYDGSSGAKVISLGSSSINAAATLLTTATQLLTAAATLLTTATQPLGAACAIIVFRTVQGTLAAAASILAPQTTAYTITAVSRIASQSLTALTAASFIAAQIASPLNAAATVSAIVQMIIDANVTAVGAIQAQLSAAAHVTITAPLSLAAATHIAGKSSAVLPASSRITGNGRATLAALALLAKPASASLSAAAHSTRAIQSALGAGARIKILSSQTLSVGAFISGFGRYALSAAAGLAHSPSIFIEASAIVAPPGHATPKAGAGAHISRNDSKNLAAAVHLAIQTTQHSNAQAWVVLHAKTTIEAASNLSVKEHGSLGATVAVQTSKNLSSSAAAHVLPAVVSRIHLQAGSLVAGITTKTTGAASHIQENAAISIGAGVMVALEGATTIAAGVIIARTTYARIPASVNILGIARMDLRAGARTYQPLITFRIAQAASNVLGVGGSALSAAAFVPLTVGVRALDSGAVIYTPWAPILSAHAYVVAVNRLALAAGARVGRRALDGINRELTVQPYYG